jgi:hypothetical protein
MEYMVRTSNPYGEDGFRFPNLEPDRVEAAFTPPPEFGRAEFDLSTQSIMLGPNRIGFSAEMPGWQFWIEGPMPVDQADRLMSVISQQTASEIGVPCEWIRMPGGDDPVRLPG